MPTKIGALCQCDVCVPLQKSRERPVFHSLNLTVPSGLMLQFLQEDSPGGSDEQL